MDNHRSHETLGLTEAAADNNILVFTFPPHTTHYPCPLDRTVFGPFGRAYGTHCSEFMSSKASALVTKMTFPRLPKAAYDQAFSRTNIVAGFEATVICAWSPLAIPPQAFAPAKPFDRTSEADTGKHPLQWVVDKTTSSHCEGDATATPSLETVALPTQVLVPEATVQEVPHGNPEQDLRCRQTNEMPDHVATELVLPTGLFGEGGSELVFAPEVLGEDGTPVAKLNIVSESGDHVHALDWSKHMERGARLHL